jgi:transcriptional regulator with XRE-family HTH domain
MSPVSDDPAMSARLRALRLWRHMTLAEVAGLAGVSAAYLSMAERGLRSLDRRSTISALAAALGVSETDLTGGPHLGSDPEQSAPHAAIPALRVALQTNTLSDPACEYARPLAQLVRALREQVEPLFSACDYVRLGQHLPPIIDELHYRAAVPEDEAAHHRALLALVEACAYAAFRAKDLGYPDLAYLAASRASEAAAIVDDPVSLGKASYVWLQTMPRSWDRTMRAAERAASTLQKHVGDDQLSMQVLGQLALTAAMAAAVTRKGPAAAHWLDEADQLADRMPDDPARAWHSFSRTNVGVWRVAVGVERGDAGQRVLDLASRVDVARLATRKSRLASFRCDVSRGLARDPRTSAEAVWWLRQAEETAPQRVRNSAAARETVAYLMTRATARAGGRELRGMAARMGVPH